MTARPEWERGAALRVACPIEDDATRHVVEQAIRAWLPQAELADDATPAVRGVPAADVLVLAAPAAGEPALDALRRARAGGFTGAVVVVMPDDRPGAGVRNQHEHDADWHRLAGCACPLGAGGDERLAVALAEALQAVSHDGPEDGPDGALEALRDALWDTRRRLAVAEVAMRLQHALNNPLAALLAEAQLLEMESLLPDHRAAVRRMVELCRRMGEAVRELDVARPDAGRTSGPTAAVGTSRESHRSGEWFGPSVG